LKTPSAEDRFALGRPTLLERCLMPKTNARPLVLAFLAGSSLLALSSSAFSHHSFAAEFSRDLPVDVTGTVTKVEWTNPHARFYVQADEGGEVVTWNFELTTPNILMRQGWSPNSLKPGDTVNVKGWRARKDPHVANAGTVKLANGKELFNGSPADAGR
jgi:hypothetical protein